MDKIIDDPKRPGRRAGHQPGDGQVEGHRLGDEGQPGQQRGHHVAKVVIADGIAGQPRVERREGGAAADAIEEGELHRLFGGADGWILGAHVDPQGENSEKDEFGNDDGGQVFA